MKLAYCCHNFYGYAETFVRDLVRGLAQDHEVHVFARGVTEGGRAMGGIELYSAVDKRSLSELLARGVNKVRRLSKQSSKEVHREFDLKLYQKHFYPALRDFAPDMIYADYGTNAVLLNDLAQELRVPLVVHFHGYDASSALTSTWYLAHLKRLFALNCRAIVPSQHLKRMLIIALSCKEEQISVIPYLPDVPKLRSLRSKVVRSDTASIVAIGRLTAKKNPLALVEAFARVRQEILHARLDLAGDGPLRKRVEERIAMLRLTDSVTLHGALGHNEALQLMAEADVFVQHSVTAPDGDQEGLPVSILEALSMGIPVVSTIHSGIPEAVNDGVNGFLVREHDFEGMSSAIIRVLNREIDFEPELISSSPILQPGIDRVGAISRILSSLI